MQTEYPWWLWQEAGGRRLGLEMETIWGFSWPGLFSKVRWVYLGGRGRTRVWCRLELLPGCHGPTALPGGLEMDQGVGQGAAGVVLAGCLEHQALLNLQPLHQDSLSKFVCGHFTSSISVFYSLRIFWNLASLYFKASYDGSSFWCQIPGLGCPVLGLHHCS